METNTLGLIAAALTTTAFIPQVVKIWRSRHTKDISLGMFAIFSIGVFLWLLYGIRIDALPVILSNGITLVLSLTILVFKLKYKLSGLRHARNIIPVGPQKPAPAQPRQGARHLRRRRQRSDERHAGQS